jgi:hypothetical protein
MARLPFKILVFVFITVCLFGIIKSSKTTTSASSQEYEYEYVDDDREEIDETTLNINSNLTNIEFEIDYNSTNFTNSSLNLDDRFSKIQKETLNQKRADSFKSWLDAKSNELHELNMNYSGFSLLNETYNFYLRKDAKFAWINFTEMILNISETISEVLHNKTLLVKDLSEQVEKAYDEYQNDTEQINKSLNFTYYDAKSPKTFCDTAELLKNKKKPHGRGMAKTETRFLYFNLIFQ